MSRPSLLGLAEGILGTGGILAYHGIGEGGLWPSMHVRPETLEAHLRQAKRKYVFLPLAEYLERRARGKSTRGCIALTFDDAYVGILQSFAPLAAELDLPATIFVVSNAAARGHAFWWDVLESARLRSRRDWNAFLEVLQLPAMDPLDPAAVSVVRDRTLVRFEGRNCLGTDTADDASPWRSMTYEELRVLAGDARFTFGCHTVSHPALTSLLPADAEREIRDGYERLQERLPRVLPILAYPYGLYDATTKRAARAAGMVAAVTMEGRAPGILEDRFETPRVGVGEVHTSRSVELRLASAMRLPLIVRNRGMRPRIPTDPPIERTRDPMPKQQ
jgi:peptidoglycan/xylan/chitin deacetylase (PgdA/CDA1 family)